MMLQQKPANQKMIYTQSGTKGPWAFKFPQEQSVDQYIDKSTLC